MADAKKMQELARQLGISVDDLMEFCERLFGSGDESLSDVGDSLELSVSAIFSEQQIADLPEDIRASVREMEGERSSKRAEIKACIDETGASSSSVELEQLVETSISAWEWEAELADKQPTLDTPLKRLLKAHYELGEHIHSFVDAALYDDDDDDGDETEG